MRSFVYQVLPSRIGAWLCSTVLGAVAMGLHHKLDGTRPG
jgi:hypothetical protein